MPVVDYYLDLAKALGCGPESRRLELALTDEEEQLGDQIWRQLGLRGEGRVVAINSSGAFGAAKLWPLDHVAALARRIADQLDHDVLIICGPQERDAARETARRAGHRRVFSLAEHVGLGATTAALRRSRLTVSTDSGPRHVAAALGRPVVTLFGPTRPIWVANPTVRGVDLQVELPCSGCRQRTCPLGHHRCMEDLSVSMVHAEVARLIEEEDNTSAAA